jgi:hypothetical protein
VKIETLSADISDINSLRAALQKIDNHSHLIEAVFFNAARVEASSLLQYPIEEVERDFRVRPNFSCVCECAADCLFQISVNALIEVARWAVPLLKFNASVIAKPSIIVTNSFLYKTPRADEFSLSVTKAAQRTLVQCMNQDFCANSIYDGLISVGGVVYDDHPTRNVENIAQKTWKFFAESNHNELELEIA